MLLRVGHPCRKLIASQSGAGRIIGITQIYDIGCRFRQRRHKTIVGRAWQVYDAAPAPVGLTPACASGHDIGIDIHRIHRIGHSHNGIGRKYISDIAYVAFGAVADKYLVGSIATPLRR